MKSLPMFAALSLLATPWLAAQNVSPEPPEDPVQKAIQEFNEKSAGKSNEVTVDLTTDSPGAGDSEKAAAPAPAAPVAEEKPVLVTGTPPEGSELVKDSSEAPVADASPNMEEPAPPAQKGMAVRVEKVQSGTGTLDPSKVKLLAPFPAKPIAPAPAGWRLEDSENAPPFTRDVELSPGKKITLKVKPHILVPESDGVNAFTVMEPGFDPALGYGQESTVGAVLSRSIRQLDEDSKQLGTVVDHLQQLLVSLPKPEEKPAPVAEPVKIPNTHKR